jgi:serine O-acetyltransferase
VINAERVGENVAIFQDVTIGVNAGKRPVIGSNCEIYTNSVILGGITVGDGVTVGACTLVNKNTPPIPSLWEFLVK